MSSLQPLRNGILVLCCRHSLDLRNMIAEICKSLRLRRCGYACRKTRAPEHLLDASDEGIDGRFLGVSKNGGAENKTAAKTKDEIFPAKQINGHHRTRGAASVMNSTHFRLSFHTSFDTSQHSICRLIRMDLFGDQGRVTQMCEWSMGGR